MTSATNATSFKRLRRRTLAFALLSLVATLAVAGQVGPGFSKVFMPDTIGPGSVSMLIFTIDNSSGPAVGELAFTDLLPSGIALAAPAFVSNTCLGTVTAPDGGDTITLIDGVIGAGQTCEIVVNVTAVECLVPEDSPATTLTAGGDCLNISGPLSFDGGTNGVAIDELFVDTGRPGFSKSFAPSTIEFGGRSTLTFAFDNSGGPLVLSGSFSDPLPAGMVVADPSNVTSDCAFPGTLTAVPGSGVISLVGSALLAAESCTISVDVIGGAIGSLGNLTGELTFSSPTLRSSGKAAAVLEVTGFEELLGLGKEFIDDPAAPGGTTTLAFTVTNRSRDDSATGITFSDDLETTLTGLAPTLPPSPDPPCGAGSSLAFSMGVLTLTGGSLPPEGSCTFSVELTVPAAAVPGTYPNTAGPASADIGGSMESSNVAGDLLFVVSFPVLTKEFTDDPVGAGGVVTLEFTITNPETTSAMSAIGFTDIFDQILPTSPSGAPAAGFCGAGSIATFTPLIDGSMGSPNTPARLVITGASLAASGSPGDSCTFSITLDVNPEAASAIYPNLTSEITGVLDAFPGPPTVVGPPAGDDLVVVGAPQLSKEFTDDPALPGGTVTLEFNLENADPDNAASAIAFTDDLGATLAGLTLTSVLVDTCAGTPGGVGTGMFSYTGGSLAASSSCTITLSLTLPAGPLPGAIFPNTTSIVTATLAGISAESPAASDDLVASGLLVTKEFTDDPVIAGGTATLVFTLDNTNGTQDATSIVFTDDLNAALTGLTATLPPIPDPPCAGSLAGALGNTFLTFAGGAVLAGTSCSFSVTATVPPGTPDDVYSNITSSVSAFIEDPPPPPPAARSVLGTTVILPPAADDLIVASTILALTKEFTDDPVNPGDPVTLEFTLTNLSATDTITDIAFDDDLDAVLSGLTATGASSNTCGGMASGFPVGLFEYSGGTLLPGASCTITLTVDVPAAPLPGSVFPNTTTGVTGKVGALDVFGDPASDDLEVQLLIFSKSFDGPTTATGTAVLSFTITNLDSVNPVADLAFSDDLDAVISGLAAVQPPSPDPPCGAGSALAGTGFLALTGGSLAAAGSPGDSCTFEVTVTVPATATAGTFVNTTSDLFESGLTVAAPATAFLTIEPPPTFAKGFAPDPILEGGISTLTFTIDNTASALAATALDFADALPAAVLVAPSPNAMTTCTGGTITALAATGVISYTGGTVGAGASCTVQADVTSAIVGAHVNLTGDLTSSSGNSGTATATLTVNPLPPLFSKEFAPDTIAEGGVTTLSFTIDNLATEAAATGLAFTDTLPAGVEVASPSNAATTCIGGTLTAVAGSGVISYSGGTVNATSTCGVSVDVTSDVAGMHDNVSGSLTSSNGDSGPASDTLTVDPAPPAFSKEFVLDTIGVDGVSTLTFTIDNTMTELDATSLDFTDSLPAGVVVASPPNAATTCTGGTVTAVAGSGVISYTGGTVTAESSCTVQADVTSDTEGEYVNTTGDLTSSAGNSGTATDTLIVERDDADLELVKVGVFEPVMSGRYQIYELTVTNLGPGDAEAVVIDDPLPAGVTLVVAEPTALCSEALGVVTCAIGDLAFGESATVTITVYVGAVEMPVPIENLATVSSETPDPVPGNDDVMVMTEVIPLAGVASLADVDGSGFPEVAVPLPGSIAVLVKDVQSLAVVHQTEVFPAGWALAAFEKKAGINGAPDDLALLAVEPSSGAAEVRVVSGIDGSLLAAAVMPTGYLPLAMTVIPDDGMLQSVIAVAAVRPANGVKAVFTYDAATGALLNVIGLPSVLWPIDLAAVDSFTGDVRVELGILAVSSTNGGKRLLMKQLTGAFVNLQALPTELIPMQLEAVPDCCGTPAAELAILGSVLAGDTVRVRTVEADSGGLVSDRNFAVAASPGALAVLPHFADTMADELAALFRNAAGNAAVRVRDAMSGFALHAGSFGLPTGSIPLGLAIAPNSYDTVADELVVFWEDEVSGALTVTLRDPGSGLIVRTVPIP